MAEDDTFVLNHQEYVQKKVNPILESMVTQVLLERPPDILPFMIRWLREYSGATASSGGENEHLKSELEHWTQKLRDLEKQVAAEDSLAAISAAPAAPEAPQKAEEAEEAAEEDEEEEEDDDEDDVVDDLPPPPKYDGAAARKPRHSVSAESHGDYNKMVTDFKAPLYKKTPEQTARIQAVLKDSFLFSGLDGKDFDIVIGAMKEKTIPAAITIINQGEEGDVMYVIEEGELECFKDGKSVKVCRPGDVFGELALMYNAPRAATVKAKQKSLVWELDRETFKHIVLGATLKRRERWAALMSSISLLDGMDTYETEKVGDVAKREQFTDGQVIVKQGEQGDAFFFIEEGECLTTKSFVDGQTPVEVMRYKRGDYFGELALLHNEPRAANVIAVGNVSVLALDRSSFKRVLGSLEAILRRNTDKYSAADEKAK